MTHGMTPADLFRIQWVSDARIVPDGAPWPLPKPTVKLRRSGQGYTVVSAKRSGCLPLAFNILTNERQWYASTGGSKVAWGSQHALVVPRSNVGILLPEMTRRHALEAIDQR